MSGTLRWSPGCKCCSTPCTLTVTVTSSCSGSAPISGATVTFSVGGTTVATGTTNSSGQVTLSVPNNTYTVTVSATNYGTNTSTHTIPPCSNFGVSLTPTWALCVVQCNMCASCFPSASVPVVVNINQTSGGTYSTTVTLTSSSSVSVLIPPGTYTFIFTATGVGSQTLTGRTMNPGCVNGATGSIAFPNNGNFCFPEVGCITAAPSSLNVTLDSATFWGTLAGTTQNIPLSSTSLDAYYHKCISGWQGANTSLDLTLYIAMTGDPSGTSPPCQPFVDVICFNGYNPSSTCASGTQTYQFCPTSSTCSVCPVTGSATFTVRFSGTILGTASCTFSQ